MLNSQNEQIVTAALSHLPVVKAPDAIWIRIEGALDKPAPVAHVSPRLWPRWTFAIVAAALLAAVAVHWNAERGPRWQVLRADGQTQTVGAGELLQTDASTAQLQVGTIGSLRIEPGTRLRILATKENNHRLSLEHGEIAAKILAPPRLFFVETKSATAVDLGCEYTMKVDDDGNGLLRVTRGWVSFEWQGRESLVPAGASCHTRSRIGPGTPYFEDAAATLISALNDFDLFGGSESALRTILTEAKPRDTLTLWHLLQRVPESFRPLVYDRMVAFASAPKGVERSKALSLDPPTLKLWKDELVWTW